MLSLVDGVDGVKVFVIFCLPIPPYSVWSIDYKCWLDLVHFPVVQVRANRAMNGISPVSMPLNLFLLRRKNTIMNTTKC